MQKTLLKGFSAAVLAGWLAIGGCAFLARSGPSAAALEPARPRVPVPVARDSESVAVLRAANRTRGAKILVSTRDRWLWYVVGRDTLVSVPVAVGMGTDFEFENRKFRFETPVGRRKVLKKETDPIWTVPDWHYMEKAAKRGLELVRLQAGSRVELEDGSFLVVRGQDVGRLNHFGNFWAFTPGTEIVFDGRIFMPPMTSRQRRVPDALGPYKLDTGNGYLIHGTHVYNQESVGEAVSHGCVRMDNADLEQLYQLVEVGTPVFIF